MVVAEDGTLRRIQNWGTLTEPERATALRRLGQRNQRRLAALRGREQQQQEEAEELQGAQGGSAVEQEHDTGGTEHGEL